MLAGKGVNGAGKLANRTGMLPYPLTNFEVQKYENQPRFNGVYSRDNLPNKLKDGEYVINLDKYSDIGMLR